MLPAYSVLLFRMNRPDAIAEIIGWAGYWDVLLIPAAVIVGGLAIRTLDRRARGVPSDEDALLQLAVGESGSASIWGRVTSK